MKIKFFITNFLYIHIESKSYSFIEQVTMITKVLYEQYGNLELDPTYFKQIIEKADSYLQGLLIN